MIEWYNLSEEEKIKQVYSKYTIQSFFDWWSNNENKFMEIRIKNFNLIKYLHKKFNYPMSVSGIYVNNFTQLKNVISLIRDKATIWFGVNPKKVNYVNRMFRGFGGADPFIDSITHIFVDIDRVDKVGLATPDDLRNADMLSNHILARLGTQKWNENYCKICSGNGVQLLIQLDVPIKMPKIIFDEKSNSYIPNEEFERTKLLIKRSIGKQIKSFCNSYKKELFVEIDATGFNIGRVAALPVTKNFKYDSFRWRGIIDMKKGLNIGLTDYLLSYERDIKKYTSISMFGKSTSHDIFDVISPGGLKKNKLAKFLLENDFPMGGINNTLWYQLKLLIRDSNYDINSNEFLDYHSKIKKKHNRSFSTNLPQKQHSFNQLTINNFCLRNMYPPVYPWRLISNKNKKNNYKITDSWEHCKGWANKPTELPKESTITEDLLFCKKQLIGKTVVNTIISSFIQGCINKYGEEYAKYLFDFVIHDYFEYS